MTLPSIALVARRGAGKSTVSRLLQTQYGYRHLSWAEPVRQIAAMAYDPRFVGTPEEYAAAKAALFEIRRPDGSIETITGTQVLQRIGTDAIRDHLDQDFWIKAGLRRLDDHVRLNESMARVSSEPIEPLRWVNDDTRFPNELEALRKRGFKIVGLSAPNAVRVARLIARDGFFDVGAESHPSETSVGLDDCDYIVDTNCSLTETERRLFDVLAGTTFGSNVA